MTLSQSEAWHTDTQTWNRNMGYSHDGESELYNIYQLGVHSRICEPCTIIYPDFCWICTKPINRYISFPWTSIIQSPFKYIARMWGSSGVKSMSNNTKVCLPCFIISTDASCLCRNTMVRGVEKRWIVKRIDMTNRIDVNRLVTMSFQNDTDLLWRWPFRNVTGRTGPLRWCVLWLCVKSRGSVLLWCTIAVFIPQKHTLLDHSISPRFAESLFTIFIWSRYVGVATSMHRDWKTDRNHFEHPWFDSSPWSNAAAENFGVDNTTDIDRCIQLVWVVCPEIGSWLSCNVTTR